MLNTKIERKCAAVCFILSFVLIPALRAQAQSDDQLLKTLPAETIFCVRINNFNNTLNQTDQFLAGASPMPMGASMLIRAQLMELLGSPQLNGLNMDGNFSVFGVAMPGRESQTNDVPNIFVGILTPVTNYKQFIDGNPNCAQPDDKGVSKITQNGTPVLLVSQVDSYALMSWANDYDNMVEYKKLMGIATSSSAKAATLATILDASQVKQAGDEPIWAYVNMQQVSRNFGPLITAQLSQMKEMMKSLENSGQGAQFASAQNIIGMYATIIDTLLKETKSVSLAINPKPNVLSIKKTIDTVPGTNMAKMFVGSTSSQQENNLLSYLKDGALMNYGCNMGSPLMRQFQVTSIDILSAMGGDSMDAEKIAKMKTLATNVLDCLTGPVAYSVSINTDGKPPFSVKYAISVKDDKKFDSLIKDAVEMMTTSGILDFYKGLGIDSSFTVNKGVDTYKGVSIDSAKLTMKSTQGGPEAQMLDTMYGGGFDYRWGLTKGLFVCAVGGNVDSKIRELIDEVQAGGTKPIGDETKAAIALIPGADKADFMVTFNLLRLYRMITAMVPMPLPQINAPTKSNIVVAGKGADGKLVVDIAIPKEHLTEIMGAFMMMQQMQMQQMQQN
ncbi:MAG: hypothetical protein JW715_00230 [Sedimentisphaerales bacterium]|nr:hypothetical protein [Sedimentisphaerales bacterium]